MDLSAPIGRVRTTTSRDLFRDALQRQEFMAELVNLRIESGIRAKDVAAAMGVTPSTVSELENHQDDPRLSTVQRYARAIGAHVDFVMLSPAARAWRSKVAPVMERRMWRDQTPAAVSATRGTERTHFALAG